MGLFDRFKKKKEDKTKETESTKKAEETKGSEPEKQSADVIQMRQILKAFDVLGAQADICKAAEDQDRLQAMRGQFETLLQMGAGLQVGEADSAAFAEKSAIFGTKLKDAERRVDDAVHKPEREKQERKNQKIVNAKKEIAEARKTPLETLIAKTKDKDIGSLRPEGTEAAESEKGQEAEKNSIWKEAGATIKGLPEKVKESVKETFSGPQEFFEKFSEKFDTASGNFSTAADLADNIGDLGEGAEKAEKFKGKKAFKHSVDESGKKEKGEFVDNDALSITGMVCTLLNSAIHLVQMVQTFVKIGKKELENSNDSPTLDGQERHKMARDALHQIVGLFGDAVDIGAGFIEAVPLLGPVLNIIKGGLEMTMDTWDMASDSYHVEMMRRERNLIFERMQAKKEKYSQDETRDDTAASAYTIEGKWYQSRATDVDNERKKMLQTVALANQDGPDKIRVIKKEDLRSRNDSRYREAQYGLGQRIRSQKMAIGPKSREEKTKLRQMEALEMMEKFREAEKAHKKMRKSVMLKVEAIIKGAVGLVSSGLNLAGQLAAMTGVGAAAGVGAMGAATVVDVASGGYDVARVGVTGAYHGVRELIGTERNKDTTRSDMALIIMDRLQEVGGSEIWEGLHFKNDLGLDAANEKDLLRQGENVRQLKSLLRGGLDVSMSDLIESENAEELQEGLAGAFGQG